MGGVGRFGLVGEMNRHMVAIDVDRLDDVGPMVAATWRCTAVANARLYRQARAAAAARDLHDAVTQSIFSASLIAEALPAQLPDADRAVQHNLDSLAKLTRGALAELRSLLLELRPEHLTATPLD